ncbi:MAG: class I SAM-dependent methyltransferase [Phycisphaerae bacterium]|jgi:SAM-dependent methyltransferase
MNEPASREVHEANRRSWNAATAAHNSHKRDQAGHLRRGGTTLFPEETSLLGDVAGLRLVHLQCNSGQDTLSLAWLGAVVTGVDISDEAIDFARKLSADSGLPGTFCRDDVHDWLAAAGERGERYDVVFSSYGSICWLSDIKRWAEGVAGVLADGGRLVVIDFHPVALMFDEHFRLAYPYFSPDKPYKWDDGVSDYVGRAGAPLAPSGFEEGVRDFENTHPAYEFQWHLSAILTAVIGAGMRIEQFHEYPFFNAAKLYETMREGSGRRMYLPDGVPSAPLMFGLVAAREG